MAVNSCHRTLCNKNITGRFLIDVTESAKQEGTRRGKSLAAAGRREVATGVVWACTASRCAVVYIEGGRGGSSARDGRLANVQQHKEDGREAAGRAAVAWVCAKLVGCVSALAAGG
jgi:hypothetical protein